MNSIIKFTALASVVTFLLAGCVIPPVATVDKKPTTPRGRLDAAFKACQEASQKYLALCDKQVAADRARAAAWNESKSSFMSPAGSHARYLDAVQDEDKAFADMKKGLDQWATAIAQLKQATEDYRKALGAKYKSSSVLASAVRSVESQQKELRKHTATYKERLESWEKQPRLRP